MPNCPYNPAHDNTATPEYNGGRLFATCNVCGKAARVSAWDVIGGSQCYTLSKAGRRKTEPSKVYSKRLLECEVKAIEEGRAFITIINNCLQLQYNS